MTKPLVFRKNQISPAWIILVLDLACSLFAVFAAFLLRLNFDFSALMNYPLVQIAEVVGATSFVLFLLFRTYTGVVRYTSMTDIGRVTTVNLMATLFYLYIDYSGLFKESGRAFPISVVLINFFIVTCLLLSYRLAVKRLYSFIIQSNKEQTTRAAIYNTGHSGLMVKQAIQDDVTSDIKIVAFLESDQTRVGKSLDGLPIYATRRLQLARMVKQEKVELLIVADEHMEPDALNKLVDDCLALDLRIQKVPAVSSWVNQGWSSQQLKDIHIDDLLERSVIDIKNQQLARELKGKSVLVTGAAGSIGSEMVRQLIKYDLSVIILCDKAESPLHELELEIAEYNPKMPVITYIADVCDRVRIQQLFEVYEPKIVYHAAAYKHVPMMEKHPSMAVMNNVLGTRILAETAVAYGAEKFVMVSTDKAVNPTNVMGASKRIAEIFTQSYNKHLSENYLENGPIYSTPPTRFITTRFGNVLGSNGSVIPRFKKQLESGGPLTVTHPDITRYFMTIPEACRLVLEAGAMGNGGEIFVFDMGQPVKVVDLAKKMIRMSGRQLGRDVKIIFTGLRPGEKLYEELLNNAENTLPTYHEKIMIATVREYDFQEVSEQVHELIECAGKHYQMPTVARMKQLVPEFLSKNSTYEQLDQNQNNKITL